MKTQDINRMYTVYQGLCKNKGCVHEAYMWDGYTRIAVSADATSCHAAARAAIRKAQAVQFVGTLRTDVRAVNNSTSGNPRADYIAHLRITDAAISPSSTAKADGTFRVEKAKADRGYAGTDQPMSAAELWARTVIAKHCVAEVSSGTLVFLVDPTRHTPSALEASAKPPAFTHGSWVEQSYLVYAVPERVVRAVRESDIIVRAATLPSLTEHYYHLHRRAVAYTKVVQALKDQLLSNPVISHNDGVDAKLARDIYRCNFAVDITKP